MRTKFTGTTTGLMATLALVTSPAYNQDVDTDTDPELEAGQERATDALQAVVYRLSVEGARGSDAAAEILTALLDGESPLDRRLEVAGSA